MGHLLLKMGVPLFIILLVLTRGSITMIAIGVDIGGTSIKGAFINDKGEILSRFSMKVDKEGTPEQEIGKLCDIINASIKEGNYEGKVEGIGIGSPGTLDMDQGIILSSPNLAKWAGFNIKKFMKERTGLPVELNNDANVAALGEAKFGSGSKYKSAIMLTLGTGVGGGIILDGKLYDGNKHQGGELGHTVIRMGGRLCGCGRKGCLEAYASATALIRDTKEMMEKHPENLLSDVAKELGGVDARNAFMAASRGDRFGKKLVKNYVMYLSEGILNYCNIFRPEVVILSGGVANEGENLFRRIRTYLKKNSYGMKGSAKVEVTGSALGYDSGKIGAACLVLFK